MHYPRVSLYALMLATAGIPLYIHLPRFVAVEMDISLTLLGGLLLALRALDFLQDPLLGTLADRFPRNQPLLAAGAAIALALGFPLLFSLGPGMIWQLVLLLILLFTGYSLGTILLYGRSETLVLSPAPRDHLRLATWREAGQITGVIIAATLPALLTLRYTQAASWQIFGLILSAIALLALWLTRPIWQRPAHPGTRLSLRNLREAGALRLLVLMVLNSLPVALTSTLFLFFTEDHLGLTNRAGFFLLVFFLCAGFAVPLWAALSRRTGAKYTLVIAMALATFSFTGAAFLAPGNATGFLIICILSGFATGADILLLPLMFSRALIRSGLKAASAFGYWSFAGKLSLAFAAAVALPLLDRFDFTPGAPLSDTARQALIFSYAVLPCCLKLLALGFTLTLPQKENPA